MSRWIELYATSPSGKTLFVCRMCGTISPIPTKTCSERPNVYQRSALECSLLEEIEGALNEEEGKSPAAREGRIVMVGEKGEVVNEEEGRYRYSVVWRSLESQWNATEIYFLGNMVENDEQRKG